MVCDICNMPIDGQPGCYLTTKELITSKSGWILYWNAGLAGGIMTLDDLGDHQFVAGIVGQFASSDSPWALCSACTSALERSGFSIVRDWTIPLPLAGHAICRMPRLNVYESIDDQAMMKAHTAAAAARDYILSSRRGS